MATLYAVIEYNECFLAIEYFPKAINALSEQFYTVIVSTCCICQHIIIFPALSMGI